VKKGSLCFDFFRKRDFFYSLNVSGMPEVAEIKYAQQSPYIPQFWATGVGGI
jgi:hypothetical protein